MIKTSHDQITDHILISVIDINNPQVGLILAFYP